MIDEITPEQALNLLDQVASTYQGTREDHAKIQLAVTILRAEIVSKQKPEQPSHRLKQRQDAAAR